jgi:predicted transglutaminase-like cysteine proteinase
MTTLAGPLVSIGWSSIKTMTNPKWLAVMDERLPKSTSEARSMQGVHDFARSHISYRRDPAGTDSWQKPAETMRLGLGDCEDICIVERCLLLNAGYKAENIELMVVRDLVTREYHALLWVNQHYLDNRARMVLHVSQFKDYLPVYGHRHDGTYLYGRIK